MIRHWQTLFTVAVCLFIVSACAPFQPSTYPPPQYPPTSSPAPGQPVPKPVPEPTPKPVEIEPSEGQAGQSNQAVQSLLDQAWQLHHSRDFDRSIAVAERAQRLNAGIAEIYLVLASNYFAKGELKFAEQLAKQGLPLVGNQWDIERRLKNLLQLIASNNR